MSRNTVLYSGLMRMFKGRRAENQMLEDMIEGMEAMPNIEAEIGRLNQERDEAQKDRDQLVKEFGVAKVVTQTKWEEMNADMEKLEAEYEAKTESLNVGVDRLAESMDIQVVQMEKALAEKTAEHAALMKDLDTIFAAQKKECERLNQKVKEESEEWEGKLVKAKADYEEYKASL